MNEVQRYMATKALTSGEKSVTQEAGSVLMKAAVGGAVIYGAAALIPFVSFLPLLLVALVLGAYLRAK